MIGGDSALYFSRVMHKRLRPFVHRFDYRVFSLWLDLDDIEPLCRRLRLLSHNRFNLFSFYDRDHGPRDGTALRPWVDGMAARHGIDLTGGTVHLLCFPRVLGYVFNPLSVYFCRTADGRLAAVLYEVRNTFGELHCYFLPVDPAQRDGAPIVQACGKRFYVSPFLPMDARYRFRLGVPGEHLSILIRQAVAEGEILLATMTGRRAALDDRALARAFLTHPLLTWKVIGAIHWQALRLWRRGASPHRRPPPPRAAVSGADGCPARLPAALDRAGLGSG